MTAKAFHPLADLLPLIGGVEFDRLVDDIAKHGLLNPITLYQDQILEGRNRVRACRAAGVEPRMSSSRVGIRRHSCFPRISPVVI